MSCEHSLTEHFVAHLPEDVRARVTIPVFGLEESLGQIFEQVRSTWSSVKVAPDVFVAFLAERIPAGAALPSALDKMHVDALYLVCAYLHGASSALPVLEAEYLNEIEATLRRTRVPPADIPDLKQAIYEKLLVAPPGAWPRIASYSGRGNLRGWLRVVASREAYDWFHPVAVDCSIDDEALPTSVDEDVELGYLKQMYRTEFDAALKEAVALLSSKDRNLLRYHVTRRLSVDQIGNLYGVHRATVARWIATIRTDLLNNTLARLRVRLQANGAEVESIMRLLRSGLNVSLESLLERFDGEL